MRILFFLFTLTICLNASAAKLKLAVLAPEGTAWANSLKKMTKEIKKATNDKIKLKVYYGGVAGDESDVLRKIRVGQLHGGFFTGKTLGEIYSDIRAIEVPFTFHHQREKAWEKLEQMSSYFNEGLRKNGFENLGFYEIGQVYVVSTKKVSNLEQLKGVKIWAWEGDKLVKAMVDSLGLVSVPLALPDVLSSLSTGIIEAAYAPATGVIALQWQTRIKYLIDYPVAFSVGALLIDNKNWKKIDPQNQKIIKEIAQKYISETNKQMISDNEQALAIMKKSGVEFVAFPQSDIAKSKPIRSDVVKRIQGSVVSKAALSKLGI